MRNRSRAPMVAGVAVLAALVAAANGCLGCDREVGTRPDLALTAVGSDEQPLDNATLHFYLWSNPHHVLDAESSHPMNGGRATLSPQTKTETVYPLCMHGVPEYNYRICVDAPGHTPLWFDVVDPTLPTELTVSLGQGPGSCSFDETRRAAAPREDLSHDNVRQFHDVPPPI